MNLLPFETTVDFGAHISSRMMEGAALVDILAEFDSAFGQCFPDLRLLRSAEWESDNVCAGCGMTMTEHEDFEPDGSDSDNLDCKHDGGVDLRRVYHERKGEQNAAVARAKRAREAK